jgi:light-regulated signal transduction histidine kinase (bacteriophytochrome)
VFLRTRPGLEFATELEPCYVMADPGGLERAVLNLLDNAVKFSPPGGRVTVRLAGGECVIEDEGPGIAAQDLPRVFDRFFRSDSARALPGSGLGLSIVGPVRGPGRRPGHARGASARRDGCTTDSTARAERAAGPGVGITRRLRRGGPWRSARPTR